MSSTVVSSVLSQHCCNEVTQQPPLVSHLPDMTSSIQEDLVNCDTQDQTSRDIGPSKPSNDEKNCNDEHSITLPGAVSFKGDILYDSSGTTYVIDGEKNPKTFIENPLRNSHINTQDLNKINGKKNLQKEKSPLLPVHAIQFLTFLKRFDNNSSENSNDSNTSSFDSTTARFNDNYSNENSRSRPVKNDTSISEPIIRSFRVHTLSEEDNSPSCETENMEDSNNNNNNNNFVTDRSSNETKRDKTPKELELISKQNDSLGKPILMCFPCRLTFGFCDSFLTHAFDAHRIQPNEKETTVLTKHSASCVIQNLDGSKYFLCFLEPIVSGRTVLTENTFEIGEPKETELTSPVNVKQKDLNNDCESSDSLDLASSQQQTDEPENSTQSEKTNNAYNVSAMSMNIELPFEATKPSSISDQTACLPAEQTDRNNNTVPSTSSDQFALDLSSPSNRSSPSNQPPNIDENLTERQSPPSMPALIDTRSEEEILKPPLEIKQPEIKPPNPKEGKHKNVEKFLSNVSDITKDNMTELMYGGGVSTLDPVFQMSMFQTRNSCKTLKCPKCNWHYKYRQTLEAHMKEKHQEETSDCAFCKANQPHPRLSRGESYACGYKPFKCEVCNYSTTTKGNLSIHMQSDKHLYNIKSIQHHQQQNGGTPGSPVPPHIIAARQEQIQNYHQQLSNSHKRLSSAMSNDATTSNKRHQNSPHNTRRESSNSLSEQSPKLIMDSTRERQSPDKKPGGMWRCDVCKYETNIARNLRIHMTSEKHAHNVSMAAREEVFKRAGFAPDISNLRLPLPNDSGKDVSPGFSSSKDSVAPPSDQNMSPHSAAMSAMYQYYLLASMQLFNNGGNGTAGSPKPSEEQELLRKRQQEQQVEQHEKLVAQQQQMAMAQQYLQMLSQMGENEGKNSKSAVMMQQLLIQQQLNLWRQFLPQTSENSSPYPVMNTSSSQEDSASPTPPISDQMTVQTPSTTHLFTCGICSSYSCNDFESLCVHVKSLRTRSQRLQSLEQEWITRSSENGFHCGLCNYSTQLKTNFSLHCKTEKHTAKLSLIAHIKEGGSSNEWKLKYAITGNNMQQVTCNGCQHTANNLDKLRTHNAGERHDGTVAMCRYLDTLLKQPNQVDFENNNLTRQLHCKPCGFSTEFVIEMVQHMQTETHQNAVEKEKNILGNNAFSLQDIITVMQNDKDNKISNQNKTDRMNAFNENLNEDTTPDVKPSYCMYCNYSCKEEKRLLLHIITQHNAQPPIRCPHCQEYLADKLQYQVHLRQVHQISENGTTKNVTEIETEENKEDDNQSTKPAICENNSSDEKFKSQEETKQHFAEKEATKITDVAESQTQTEVKEEKSYECPHCGENLNNEDKFKLHLELHRIKASADSSTVASPPSQLSCSACQVSFQIPAELHRHLDAKHHSKNLSFEHGKPHSQQVTNNQSDPVSTDLPDIYENPTELLKTISTKSNIIDEIIKDSRFQSAWDKLPPPFTCAPCEASFMTNNDLLNHIKQHSSKKSNDSKNDDENVSTTADSCSHGVQNNLSEVAKGKIDEESMHNKGTDGDNDGKTTDTPIYSKEGKEEEATYKVNFSAICPVGNTKRKSHYPGTSLLAHREVLVNVGLDHVTHFIENRSHENRQRAREWKKTASVIDDQENWNVMETINEVSMKKNTESSTNESGPSASSESRGTGLSSNNVNTTNGAEDENSKVLNTNGATQSNGLNTVTNDGENNTISGKYPCLKCGKEFSTVWVLRVHEKVNHDNDLTCDEVEEFAKGYSKWFWNCAKEEASEQDEEIKARNKKIFADVLLSTKKISRQDKEKINTSSSSGANKAEESVVSGHNDKEEKSFQQVALDTLMKNYGLSDAKKSTKPPQALNVGANNAQQQMLMQLLMQSQVAGNGNENMNQQNALNNMLQMMYGGANMPMPGQNFPHNIAEMLSGAAAGNIPPQMMGMSYHWLALAAQQQQQQQLQQLLMYPQLAQAMPFLQGSGMPDESRQQLLAMLASSQMAGQIPGMPGVNPATIAAALQMYQGANSQFSTQNNEHQGNDKDKANIKIPRLNSRPSVPPPLIPAHQMQASAVSKNSDAPIRRPRTRITDDQLKILRSHFDINTSPGDDQIAEMAMRTGLPSKVIKHWFRNTLFKERQRSKDSPYNFNIPPMTSLNESKSSFDIDINNSMDTEQKSDRSESNDALNMSRSSFVATSSQNSFVNTSSYNQSSPVHDSESNDSEALKPNEKQQTNSSAPGVFPPEIPQALFTNALALMPTLSKMKNEKHPSNRSPEAKETMEELETNYSKFDSNALQLYNSVNPLHLSFSESNIQDYASIGGNKRTPRTRFSDYQLRVLQEFFDRNAYPKDDDLDKMSQQLDLSTRVIVVWFQNARQKARKNYEMQQQQGGQKRNSISKSYSNSYMSQHYSTPKAADYSISNQGSPAASKSPEDFQSMARSRSITPTDAGLQNKQYMRAMNTPPSKDEFENTNSVSSISDKRASIEDSKQFSCKVCGTFLPSLQAFQQHMQMHAMSPSYMANMLRQYPSLMLSKMLGNQQAISEDRKISQDGREERKNSLSEQPVFHSRNPSADLQQYNKPSIKVEQSESPYSVSSSSRNNRNLNTVRTMLVTPPMANSLPDTSMRNKRKMSVSPTHSASSSSSALSPGSARSQAGNSRDGTPQQQQQQQRDPKRLRTTITPEQLQFLYQQYMIDSSPSRKVIEHISEIVGLTKRVVQVWFQNTRARERKGQFRSVGRITSTLGQPQSCPHCDTIKRNKADMDAHIREAHSNLAPSIPPSIQSSAGTMWPEKLPSSQESNSQELPVLPSSLNINPNVFPTISSLQAFKEKSEKAFELGKYRRKHSADLTQAPSPKQRKVETEFRKSESDYVEDNRRPEMSSANSFSSLQSGHTPSSTHNLLPVLSEQKIGKLPELPKNVSNSLELFKMQQMASNMQSDNAPKVPQPEQSSDNTSPFSHEGSPNSSPTQEGQSKRYRTQMSSDQVWFQNARAKEKKAKQNMGDEGQMFLDSEQNQLHKTHCEICPEVKYTTIQEMRDHLFSPSHLAKFRELNHFDRSDVFNYDKRYAQSSPEDLEKDARADSASANNILQLQPQPNTDNSSSPSNEEMEKRNMSLFMSNKPAMQYAMQQMMARNMSNKDTPADESAMKQQMEQYKAWFHQMQMFASHMQQQNNSGETDANNNSTSYEEA